MKKNILFYIFAFATFLSPGLFAANYEDGQAAFEAENYKQAIEIWENLVEQGDVNSQLKMADLYIRGTKVEKDVTAAFKLYNQAAEQGSSEAMLVLGQIHMIGQTDADRDPEKAREWYLKAAKLGYAKAQFYYGASYFRGEGVEQDYVQAHAWMQVATIGGYELAKQYKEEITGILSEEQLVESKSISDRLLAEIK